MKKIEYYFQTNRVKAQVVKDFTFRLVSDRPLSNAQIEIIQEKLGYPTFPYQMKTNVSAQREKLTKNTLQWTCYSV